MSKIVTCTNVTLDGVMQAPARADEDTRDGFTHGGWAAPYAAMVEAGQVFANAGALLFGRRTYEDFYDGWPKRANSPFTPWLTGTPKYVASRTLTDPLPWANSVRLEGNVTAAVRALKQQPGKDILVLGSGELIHTLMQDGLIDEYVLLIHPIVLGSGRRLFGGDGTLATLTLSGSRTTASGVIVATYRSPEAE
jgi:dihydrofolate reductase